MKNEYLYTMCKTLQTYLAYFLANFRGRLKSPPHLEGSSSSVASEIWVRTKLVWTTTLISPIIYKPWSTFQSKSIKVSFIAFYGKHVRWWTWFLRAVNSYFHWPNCKLIYLTLCSPYVKSLMTLEYNNLNSGFNLRV